MFEKMTYEYLLKRALSNVPTDVDKRQGSIIYDVIAPCCAELAQLYISLDIMLDNSFADTATREYLIRRAKEVGIEPHLATNAELKLEAVYTGTDEYIKPGDRFSADDISYIALDNIICDEEVMDVYPFDNGITSENVVKGQPIPGCWRVMCETEGTQGNRILGSVLPINTIKDLAKATITEVIVPGEDEETTEDFRKRYFEKVNAEAFGGNRASYKQLLGELDGVGMVKLARTPNAGGTVGVIITASDNNVPSSELVAQVKDNLDPVEYEGLGEGTAPVGHVVEVSGATAVRLNISVKWQLTVSANITEVLNSAANIVKSYITEINSKWEDTDGLTLNAYQLMTRISDIVEIVDITELTINGGRSVLLQSNEIFDNTIILNGDEY